MISKFLFLLTKLNAKKEKQVQEFRRVSLYDILKFTSYGINTFWQTCRCIF